jgi:hypothetical protein
LDNGNVAFVYIINGQVKTMDGSYFEDKSSAFLTIIDPNGVVISNRIVGELIAINDSNKFNHNNYALCFVSKNGMIFHGSDGNQFFVAKLNESQLAKVGVDDLDAYRDNYQDSLIVATLPTGHKVTATGGPGIPKSQGSFKIASPIYAAKTANELIPNYDIASNYVTNPDQKQLILSVPPEAKTDIKISSNPNSVTIINGFDADTNANKLTFPVDLNLVKIDKVLSSQYSVIDLLAGKFAPSDLAPNKNLQLVPLEKTLSLEEENKILRDNNDKEKVLKIWSKAWSNDNEQLKANEEDKFLDLDQESSILLLPKKQAVVMFGVANANLINHPENYFSQNQLPANDSSKQFPTTTIIGISAALLGAVGLGFVARKYAANRNNDRIAVPTSELDEQNNDLEVPNSEVEIMEMRHNVKAERDKAKVVSR